MAYRRDSGGARPSCAMIEYAAGISLPDDVVSHPAVMAMEEATSDMISCCNDIYSYKKEHTQGDVNNLVMVLMNEQGLDLQRAVDQVGAHWNAAL